MNVIRHARELAGRKVCLAIGVFDGVHLGHQQVLRQTISDAHRHGATAVAITFDRHPSSVVAPERTPPLIYSLPQKLRAIASLGVDATLLVEFNKVFSSQSGEAFIRSLVENVGQLFCICVGATFTFGHKRSGNVELLRNLGSELKFAVHGLAALSLDGQPVSSTRIRDVIRSGDLDAASQMIGRPYSVAGKVVRGDALGRQLGAPTANLDVSGLMLPPGGVYAAHALVGGRLLHAAVNIGHRPTLGHAQPTLRVEAHLIDFEGDLYDQELELIFVEKLREERAFPSLDALKAQIQEDLRLTRQTLE
ncbi:MAG: bifunctional riboflavin kinase/FAD synthetase [Pedosphaera sp.]|nr:bifunctional riboflavin kinase/FAD synthetase [Pedosphaera sp.]